jgi:hypothetical protein
MSIVTFKDFTIENITDTVHEVHEFQGTFADNRTNICEILIEISTEVEGKEIELQMTIKPQEIGTYHCYGDDRDKGFGISTEIFKDLISHALDGADSLTLKDFVTYYFEKFGSTHSVELRYGKRAYLGHTVLYLTTEEFKTKDAVSLVDILGNKVQLAELTTGVIQFNLNDLTVELVEKLVEGVKLSKSSRRDYELSLDHLQYAKEVAEKRNSLVYYKSALELLLEVKSKHPWGIFPLELVCKNNIVRGEIKSLFLPSIKKMEDDNFVYSLEELLKEVN